VVIAKTGAGFRDWLRATEPELGGSILELELELLLFIALPQFTFNLLHDNNCAAMVQQTHSTQTSGTRSCCKAVVKLLYILIFEFN
jgi:hypothetical protein